VTSLSDSRVEKPVCPESIMDIRAAASQFQIADRPVGTNLRQEWNACRIAATGLTGAPACRRWQACSLFQVLRARGSGISIGLLGSAGCQPLLRVTLIQANRELQPFFGTISGSGPVWKRALEAAGETGTISLNIFHLRREQ